MATGGTAKARGRTDQNHVISQRWQQTLISGYANILHDVHTDLLQETHTTRFVIDGGWYRLDSPALKQDGRQLATIFYY